MRKSCKVKIIFRAGIVNQRNVTKKHNKAQPFTLPRKKAKEKSNLSQPF